MELLTLSEAAERLAMKDIPKYIALRDPARMTSSTFYLPTATRDQTILARSIGGVVSTAGPCWLQITYWSNDLDSNQQLFYGYRRGSGDRRSLAEASIYSFDAEEESFLASILSLVIYFRWDARIFDSELTYQVRVNNDGFLDVESSSAVGIEIEKELSLLGLLQMSPL